MTLPLYFRSGEEKTLANFDFYDIASGTGYILFYAGKAGNSWTPKLTTYKYITDTSVFTSIYAYTEGTTTNAAATKVIDLDFDALVSRPLTLRGVAVLSVPTASNNGEASNCICYVVVRIRKWNGSTETEIALSDDSAKIGGAAGLTYLAKSVTIVVPETIINAGEYLRVTIEGWLASTSATNGRMRIAHNPMGTVADWDATGLVTSQLTIPIPIKIEL